VSTYDRVGVNVLLLEDITIPYIFKHFYTICKNMAVVKNYEREVTLRDDRLY